VGGGIPLTQSVLNTNLQAYRRRSGLIGFRRPIEFGLYGPRLSSGAAFLGLAYHRPGPLGTLHLPDMTQEPYNQGNHSYSLRGMTSRCRHLDWEI